MKWRVSVDARLEVDVEADTGRAAEKLVEEALESKDPPSPFDHLDWSLASVVHGSAVEIREGGS